MSEKSARLATRPQLKRRRSVADRINRALEKSDIEEICQAIAAATRLYNISDLARRAGIERPSVYRAFAGGRTHPNFTTVLNVLDAMGFQMSVSMREVDRPRLVRSKSSAKCTVSEA